ncbi:MAG: hypothetical protein HY788_08300 [Deltaproteobacteria bacterium]|nr:hypothetical protein [Deltaproteobacteria bacterium]
MPLKARMDAPGALHHIICRVMERRHNGDAHAISLPKFHLGTKAKKPAVSRAVSRGRQIASDNILSLEE